MGRSVLSGPAVQSVLGARNSREAVGALRGMQAMHGFLPLYVSHARSSRESSRELGVRSLQWKEGANGVESSVESRGRPRISITPHYNREQQYRTPSLDLQESFKLLYAAPAGKLLGFSSLLGLFLVGFGFLGWYF